MNDQWQITYLPPVGKSIKSDALSIDVNSIWEIGTSFLKTRSN